jgi:hypothetical protein
LHVAHGLLPVVLLLALLLWDRSCRAQGHPEAVAVLGPMEGAVDVLRAGQTAFSGARLGQDLFPGDRIRTGEDGKVQILFVDDTMVVLGTRSEMEITRFVFRREAKERRALLDVLGGKVRFLVTRFLADRKPDVLFRTSTAVVGVRGTEGVIRMMGPLAVFCLGGGLEVLNQSTGQTLDLAAMTKTMVVPHQPMVLEAVDPGEVLGLRTEFRIRADPSKGGGKPGVEPPPRMRPDRHGVDEPLIRDPAEPKQERSRDHYD